MRNLIRKISTSVSIRTISVCLLSVAVVGLIPAAVMAWGPARATFTMQNAASYVTFNSITDNPTHGDERNFSRAKESTANDGSYNDTVALTAGKQYTIMIFYHNNAKSSLNAGGTGIAHGAYARAEVPAVVKNGVPTDMEAYVGATNANPTNVYDEVKFTNSTGADIYLHYVPGSTVIHSFGAVNNKVMPDTILSPTGVKLGYNSLNGDLPGCNEYSGYITFKVQADQPSFTFKKEVRVNGTKEWKDSVNVASGTKVDYLLSYKNASATVTQKNVVFKDDLPKGLAFVAGSSRMTKGTDVINQSTNDGISTSGIDMGNYSPGGAAYLMFSATVDSAPCTTLTNTAAVETDSGNLKDTATVTVSGECTLPTTGPVEVISGFIGIAAITIGVVYYYRSRQQLSHTLINAQAHPTVIGHAGTETLVELKDKKEHKEDK